MAKHVGFIEFDRKTQAYRDVEERSKDYKEIYDTKNDEALNDQAARCMDCGVPFCMSDFGCPVSNAIPEWNDLAYRGRWKEAILRLHKTNNFPEFTGRVCPAPCEGACVLDHVDEAVTIKNIENTIIDHAFAEGWIVPQPPKNRTGKKIAIVGSGPTGLAAAAQLNKAGHHVTVYERDDRIGGLLMYGIPNMKLEKKVVDRRVSILREEGIDFITNTDVGGDSNAAISIEELREEHDAVLLATGSTIGRDLPVQNRQSKGIYPAMNFLTQNTKNVLNKNHVIPDEFNAAGKNVIVIGGGDTGTDCIATSVRHGAKSIVNFEFLPKASDERGESNPWPQWPKINRTDYGHQEANLQYDREEVRTYSVLTKEFVCDEDQQVIGIKTVDVKWTEDKNRWKMKEIEGSERLWEADLVLLAMGYTGPETYVSESASVDLDEHSNYKANFKDFKTNQEGIYAAGDCRRGQSLVVWAIREGRDAAREIDRELMGETSLL